jgi:hypothetical protein
MKVGSLVIQITVSGKACHDATIGVPDEHAVPQM